ncbi:MAG: hypothetical protein EA397_08040 [Deltaproteobacteria bacterium]|nr:MAG: hypothetical protein EA397_08040 [Deltaproteobacteria bacterium]
MRRAMLLLTLLVGCGTSFDDWPDVRGRYSVQIIGTQGCDSAMDHLQWVNGPLFVEGEVPDLIFDFADGFSFEGSSTESGRFSFRGSPSPTASDDLSYDVVGSGMAAQLPGRIELEGSVDVSLDSDEDCTHTGTFVATQVAS